MIKVSIKKENERIKEVVIKGHALYDTLGKDIVCAAVSSIVITTVNGILSFDKDAIIERDLSEIENLYKGGPIAYADYFILNNSTIDDEINSIKKIIDEV